MKVRHTFSSKQLYSFCPRTKWKKKPNKNRSPERFDHNSRERSDVNWTEINSASRYNYDSVAVELCSGLMASMWWRAARCECSIDYAHNKFSSIQEAVRWRSLKRMCELNEKIFKCAKVCECKCSNNRICWCWCSLKNNTLRVSRMSVVRFGRILDNRKKTCILRWRVCGIATFWPNIVILHSRAGKKFAHAIV